VPYTTSHDRDFVVVLGVKSEIQGLRGVTMKKPSLQFIEH
jgi:hypothetical protein